MKKITLLFVLFLLQATYLIAQTNYTLTFTSNGGNPGSLNIDNDNIVTGWTGVLTAPLNANQWSAPVALPFAFDYYGNAVTSFKASANGLLTFNTASTLLPNNNENLPSAAIPDSTIACFWDAFTNLPPTGGDDSIVSRVWGTAPNRQFWIKWVSFEMGSPSLNSGVTFSCVLEEGTNKIYLVEGFAGATPTLSSTVGLQLNAGKSLQDGNRFRPQSVNSSQTAADNDYYTFTPFLEANMAYVGSTAEQPIVNFVSRNNSNEAIVRVAIQASGELSPINVTDFSFSTNGTTNVTDITNTRLFYTGADSTFNTKTQFGSTVNTPTGIFNIAGSQALAKGTNYFWLTYSISNVASSGNVIDAELVQMTVGGNVHTPTVSAPSGNRSINIGLSGLVTVGSGSTYTYLSDVFKDINANGLVGNLVLSITSDMDDTAQVVLNYNSGADYKISIVPSADVLRNITSRFTSSYITLDGTENFVIDGKGPVSGTGKYLRFVNRTDSGATFTFINGSRFDTIRNCIIEGACTSPLRGVITLANSTNVSTGIRDLLFDNNDIRDISDSMKVPANLIYSASTSTTLLNSDITISNNNLFNFRRAGILVSNTGNGGNWNILNNSFYYNAPIAPSGGDIVPIILVPGQAGENNLISGNYIGGQAPLCGGAPWLSANAVNWVAMNINAGLGIGTSIQGNTIQNLNITTTAGIDFVGIRLESGRMFVGTLTGNTIGHISNANSIQNAAKLTLCIYSYISSAGDMVIANNTIANITGTGTGTTSGVRGISIQGGASTAIINQNTIYNLNSSTPNTNAQTAAVLGIAINGNDADNNVIRNNTIYNINANNTTIATVSSGMIYDGGGVNSIIENNKISRVNNISTSTTAAIHGLLVLGNMKNGTIRNNMISISNGTNTNGVIIRGITDNASGNVCQYLNNTVFVGGSAASGALNSYAFERRNTANIGIRNNIFYNKRTGGTGFHAAIAAVNASAGNNWNQNSSDYNLLVAANAAQVGVWTASLPQTFASWQTVALGADRRSWSDNTLNIPATLFVDTLSADLRIDSSLASCWYAKGKGIALANVSTDIHGQARPTAIIVNVSDIGADAFTTTTTPPALTQTGNIATNDSTVLSFAGRVLGKIYWLGGTQYPSAVTAEYYSTIPSITALGDRFNTYYSISQTGTGNLFDAMVQLAFDSAITGSVTNNANIQMAYGSSPTNWTLLPTSTVNTSNSTYTSSWLTQTTFTNLYTGTSSTNPLPVKLTSFAAQYNKNAKTVQLYWNTASEVNSNYFEIQRSVTGTDFEKAGQVKAAGNSNTNLSYLFNDTKLPVSNKVYYRLKMVDRDGSFAYSKTVEVSLLDNSSETPVLVAYPNPVVTDLTIELAPSVSPIDVKVYNIVGELVSQKSIAATANTQLQSIAIEGNKGMYFVVVNTGTQSQTIKVVKQ
ncbi:MAG: T9SS type A sorting domain-containing protein [Bacteroidota bacterium]